MIKVNIHQIILILHNSKIFYSTATHGPWAFKLFLQLIKFATTSKENIHPLQLESYVKYNNVMQNLMDQCLDTDWIIWSHLLAKEKIAASNPNSGLHVGKHVHAMRLNTFTWLKSLSQASEAEERWFESRCYQSWEGWAKGSAQLSLCNFFWSMKQNDRKLWLRVELGGFQPKDLMSWKGILQQSSKILAKYLKYMSGRGGEGNLNWLILDSKMVQNGTKSW